jgi:hypothetical protein
MSNSYKQCTNCGNTDNGDDVHRCNSCRKFFCTGCALLEEDAKYISCPACDSDDYKTVGEINNQNSNSTDSVIPTPRPTFRP